MAVGAILMFDFSRKESYDNLNHWYKELKQLADPNVRIVLVGNKSDLHEKEVEISAPKKWATEKGIQFFEASAKKLKNVEEPFKVLIEGKNSKN